MNSSSNGDGVGGGVGDGEPGDRTQFNRRDAEQGGQRGGGNDRPALGIGIIVAAGGQHRDEQAAGSIQRPVAGQPQSGGRRQLPGAGQVGAGGSGRGKQWFDVGAGVLGDGGHHSRGGVE
jgi:hypothetical protein